MTSFDNTSNFVQKAVKSFYDYFPYPADSLIDSAPPGYNWWWSVDAVYSFLTGSFLNAGFNGRVIRILDAGCGSGVSTDYLAHQNPGAEIYAVDISEGTLEVARERLERSGALLKANVRFENRSLFDLVGEEPFDYINSVGVLHHLSNPKKGLKVLASLLKPGAFLHLFLYSESGRTEINRIKKALKLMGSSSDSAGVELGRELFSQLPSSNRLRLDYVKRWEVECQSDANFADMYLHPYEINYTLETLFELIDSSELRFVKFSNPQLWNPERFLNGKLLDRARALSQRKQWQLIENLDPDLSHFEFFLVQDPFEKEEWLEDSDLLASNAKRSTCLWGWPNRNLLDFKMDRLELSQDDFDLLKAIDIASEGTSLELLPLSWNPIRIASVARGLHQKQVLWLSRS